MLENVENIVDNNKNKLKKSLRELAEETLAALETIETTGGYKSDKNSLFDYLTEFKEYKITLGIDNDGDCDWAISHARKLLSDIRELSDDEERSKRLERIKLINEAIIKYQNKCLKELGLPTISENNSIMPPCKNVEQEVNNSIIKTSNSDRCLVFLIIIIIIIFIVFYR